MESAATGITTRLNGIAGGNGTLLAVGEARVALTSTDAVTWTTRNTGVTGWLRGVVYAKNTFVVTGQDGVILTTTDGVSFAARSSGTVADLEAVIYDGTEFVAVGAGLTEATSTDGVTWTSANNPAYAGLEFRGAAYLNGIRILAGDDGDVVLSKGTPVWTGTPPTTGWYALAVGYDTAIAVGASGTIAYSGQDGVAPVNGVSIDATLGPSATDLGDFVPYVGSNLTLTSSVVGGGTVPLAYTWTFNGQTVGNGPVLNLTNLSPTQVGAYSLSVSNPAVTYTRIRTQYEYRSRPCGSQWGRLTLHHLLVVQSTRWCSSRCRYYVATTSDDGSTGTLLRLAK